MISGPTAGAALPPPEPGMLRRVLEAFIAAGNPAGAVEVYTTFAPIYDVDVVCIAIGAMVATWEVGLAAGALEHALRMVDAVGADDALAARAAEVAQMLCCAATQAALAEHGRIAHFGDWSRTVRRRPAFWCAVSRARCVQSSCRRACTHMNCHGTCMRHRRGTYAFLCA